MRNNRPQDGKWNLCGSNVARLRLQMRPKCSQRALADKLQLMGMECTKNTIQSIESGARTVSDIELKYLSEFFGVAADELLSE